MFGQQLSSFRVESWLGAGSLAIVYRGVDETTGERVAIKVARQACESAPRRLMHSCEILARLDHESIVRVREVGCHNGHYYLVMEFIPGSTVADVRTRAVPCLGERSSNSGFRFARPLNTFTSAASCIATSSLRISSGTKMAGSNWWGSDWPNHSTSRASPPRE